MSKHTIDAEGLDELSFEHTLACSVGVGRKSKWLLAVVHPVKLTVHLKVQQGKETVLLCNDFAEAVATYNDLP